ncbi:MAG TPA: 5'/3'-nucleotidase SurE [Acidimicrobiales bacterium]|nr:5'/3'-nucleotidase SurE [Acidimicrobiales bacterium]
MRVLITNDDGVGTRGILELARTVHELGHDVVVAAPREEASGASASLTSVQKDGRTVVESRSLDGLDAVPVFGVAASPAFISLIALRGAFGDAPEMVVSGINEGPNTGRAVIHSGTVGAALTAATYGARGLAVSIELGQPRHWSTAHELIRAGVSALAAAPQGTTLNLNVPNRPASEVLGLRSARLAPFGTVQARIAESGEGYVKLAYTEPAEVAPPDSDAALLAEGYATITALQSTAEVLLEDLENLLMPTSSSGGG